ncbi:MAG: CHAT domain-containing protein [Bradymonadaceae bacterium]
MTLVTALLVASCASGPPAPDGEDPIDVHRAETGWATEQTDRRERVVALRRQIERGEYRGRCPALPEVDDPGWEHWLGAWCHVRDRHWSAAKSAALEALTHFETAGRLRRQLEMHLIAALSDAATGSRPRTDLAHAERASHLFKIARVTLHGPVEDPFAGDLPYLIARAARAGVTGAVPTSPTGERGTAEMLFATARFNYRVAGLEEARFSVDIEAARGAIDRGQIDTAFAHLERALTRAARREHPARIRRAAGVFAQLTHRIGLDDAARSVSDWADGGSTPAPLPETAPIPRAATSNDPVAIRTWLDRRLTTAYGRRLLAAELAGLRANPDLAARPPTPLIDHLREADAGRVVGDGAWRLGHQAGRLLAEQGYRTSSRAYLEHAVSTLETIRLRIPDPTLRQTFYSDKRPVYRALIDSYVGVDTPNLSEADYTAALRIANGLKARGLIDLLRNDIAPEQTVEATGFSWEPPRDVADAADQLLAQLDAWRADADRDRPPPSFVSDLPGALVDRIPADTAVVEYMLGPGGSYVWVLTDDGMQMRRIAGRRTLDGLVSGFMETLVDPHLDADAHGRHRELGERLYVELLGPIDDLLADHDHLVIAADTSLYPLPFEALIRPGRSRAPEYVAERQVVSYTPSSAVLARMATADRPEPGGEALVMGAPKLDRPAIDLLAVADRLPDSGMMPLGELFPSLPGIRVELNAVAGALDGRTSLALNRRTGRRATEHFLRTADLKAYRIIHLTTHGVSDARPLGALGDSEIRMRQPALMLSQNPDQPEDGVLTLGEILSYRTGANLVALSGCTTGRGWRALGDGAYGLAGAFLFAGAEHVIASTWNVADRDTTELMTHVYRAIGSGASPPEALNAGQRAMIASHDGGDTLSPYYWAGFRIVGGLPSR